MFWVTVPGSRGARGEEWKEQGGAYSPTGPATGTEAVACRKQPGGYFHKSLCSTEQKSRVQSPSGQEGETRSGKGSLPVRGAQCGTEGQAPAPLGCWVVLGRGTGLKAVPQRGHGMRGRHSTCFTINTRHHPGSLVGKGGQLAGPARRAWKTFLGSLCGPALRRVKWVK